MLLVEMLQLSLFKPRPTHQPEGSCAFGNQNSNEGANTHAKMQVNLTMITEWENKLETGSVLAPFTEDDVQCDLSELESVAN